MIEVEGIEITALYLLLKKSEDNLDDNQSSLLRRIENFMYEHLSIQEIEDIGRLYNESDSAIIFKET